MVCKTAEKRGYVLGVQHGAIAAGARACLMKCTKSVARQGVQGAYGAVLGPYHIVSSLSRKSLVV